jgi:acetoin utilization deacetylase AcuC-like enzyme
VSGGRLVAVLEGGYDLGALGRSLVEVVRAFEGAPAGSADAPAREEILPAAASAIARTLAAHGDQPWTRVEAA